MASGNESFRFFEKAMQSYPLLKAEQERDLAERIRNGDEEAWETMILANIRLVIKIARTKAHLNVPLEELVNEGLLGLMEAVKGFDPMRGCRFSTYATPWIRNSMQAAGCAQGQPFRVTSYMREMIARMNSAQNDIACAGGRKPSDDELAERMGITRATLNLIRKAMHASLSVSLPSSEHGHSLGENIMDIKTPQPDEAFIRRLDAAVVKDLLECLSPRAATVVKLRYGLCGLEERTLQQIGREMRITKERVRQIEQQAIRILKRVLRGAARPGLHP